MTDFYGQLEGQLLEAGRRRTGQGRVRRAASGRARLVLAACAAVLLLAAGGALVPGLLSGTGTNAGPTAGGGAVPAPERPPAVAPPIDRKLRGVRVAVLNGTTRTGLARSIGDFLERRGATITAVDSSPDQAMPVTIVAYADDRAKPQAVQVARALGIRRVDPYAGVRLRSIEQASVIVLAGSDRGFP